jgi:hypothetical protein
MAFAPRLAYTSRLVNDLGAIEAARAVVDLLPLPPDASLRLRHDALQRSTRSSTQIEGNPLDVPDNGVPRPGYDHTHDRLRPAEAGGRADETDSLLEQARREPGDSTSQGER